eukprot:4293715-Pleurochrysis_carterae.AAC.3
MAVVRAARRSRAQPVRSVVGCVAIAVCLACSFCVQLVRAANTCSECGWLADGVRDSVCRPNALFVIARCVVSACSQVCGEHAQLLRQPRRDRQIWTHFRRVDMHRALPRHHSRCMQDFKLVLRTLQRDGEGKERALRAFLCAFPG